VLDKVFVYNRVGTVVRIAKLPSVSGRVTSVGGDQVYVQGVNAVFDFQAGTRLWHGDDKATDGVVVGDHILFTRSHRVFVDRFR
jgi:hypothetical protein